MTAVVLWAIAVGLVLQGGPVANSGHLGLLLLLLSAAAASTAVCGVLAGARGPEGAFEVGYRIGLRDGHRASRTGQNEATVIRLPRRRVDV